MTDTKQINLELSIYQRLAEIQKNLNAPKTQRNSFGGYMYRSCEDIMAAVKPLLDGLVLVVNDDIVVMGDRVYVKATARITDGKESIEATAFAREPASKKGSDESQITGAASSYARKYALNGLLLIDDEKDADSTNTHGKTVQKQEQQQAPRQQPFNVAKAISDINNAQSDDVLRTVFANAWKQASEAQRAPLQDAYEAKKIDMGVPA